VIHETTTNAEYGNPTKITIDLDELAVTDKVKKTVTLSEGKTLPLSGVAVKEGITSPPKHFTVDAKLFAMETARKDDMPEDAESKGSGPRPPAP
jgi:hypothetical protein